MNHTSRYLIIKLLFSEQSLISESPDKDVIMVNILEPSLFKSAQTLKSIEETQFLGSEPTLQRRVPQIVDPQIAQALDSATETAASSLTLISSSNLVITLILGASMQKLWGMIRSMQMIVMAALLRVPSPAHTFHFFVGCMTFAQMDVLDGSAWYPYVFEFTPSEPLNLNYEMMAMSTKNFIMNSASYLIYMVAIFVSILAKKYINQFLVKYGYQS